MSDLTAQRRMAADILDIGKSRIWFDPDEQAEIADAITREDIRDLIESGTIQEMDAKSNSKGRARKRAEKRAYGHQKGPGSKKGRAGGRKSSKDEWVSRIRAQRRRLKELRDEGPLTPTMYRTVYNKASGGEFQDVNRLEAYITNTYDVEIN